MFFVLNYLAIWYSLISGFTTNKSLATREFLELE